MKRGDATSLLLPALRVRGSWLGFRDLARTTRATIVRQPSSASTLYSDERPWVPGSVRPHCLPLPNQWSRERIARESVYLTLDRYRLFQEHVSVEVLQDDIRELVLRLWPPLIIVDNVNTHTGCSLSHHTPPERTAHPLLSHASGSLGSLT